MGVIVIGAGALGLLLSLLVWGSLNPAARRRASPRGHDSGTPTLVRPEKRLYLGELPLAAEGGLHREQSPL